MDKSDFETMLKTWSKTESPPEPSRNAVIIMLVEIFFSFIKDTILIPLVISKSPVKIDAITWEGRFNHLQIGSNIMQTKVVIPLTFKIEIITENKTTKPPIIRIVEIADWILEPKISPKFDTVMFCSLLSCLETLYCFFVTEFFFQNLNINPTVIHAKICVIKSRTPTK